MEMNKRTNAGKRVSIGKQDFASLIENNFYYVDKTDFIKEWWDSGDDVTLITRPRRFGKTLNMSMLNCFFSINMLEEGICSKGCQSGRTRSTGKYREHIR